MTILSKPQLYQLYQEAGGFFQARVTAIGDYLPIRPGARIIDIGCGPGHIVRHLPAGVDYVGFDIDAPSIAFARRHFRHLGRFFDRPFDQAAAAEFGPADVVMMNGVMHHLPDAMLEATLAVIDQVLAPDGVLFTLDGCYRSGQSWLERWLMDNDRGKYVREADAYSRLLERTFPKVAMHLRQDLARLPYSFAIAVARKQ